MKKIISSGTKRKFISGSEDINFFWLPFFRFTVAVFCLFHFLSLFKDMGSFLGDNAYINIDISDIHKLNGFIPTLYDVATWFSGNPGQHTINVAFSVVYITSLFFLAMGFMSRLAAIVACFLHLMLLNSLNFFIYGVDYFCSIALFYCVLFPVGKVFALDNYFSLHVKNIFFKSKKLNKQFAAISLFLLQANMCIAYFFGGLDKLLGYNWRNGESMWKALHLYSNPDLINLNFLYNTPVFLMAGWGVIITEMLYPVFVNIRTTRKLWLFFIILMHLSIALFLGLFFFSTFMIILNLSAYYVPYMKRDENMKLQPYNIV